MKGNVRGLMRSTDNGDRATRLLDAIDANIVVLDSEGFIVTTNKGWRKFAADNRLSDGSYPKHVEVGANYLGVCSAASGGVAENAMRVYEGIQAVLHGRKISFSHEYPCHSPVKQRWFLMKVKALPRTKPREVAVTHIDISDRYLAEIKLLNKQQALSTALLQLQEMAEKIKISLGKPKYSTSTILPVEQQIQPQVDYDLVRSLSKREIEVLAGLVRGERNSAIASRLKLSRKSVSTYQSRIFDKLRVESVAQLVSLMSRTPS